MASKRNLKKTIRYIGSELATEVMYKSLLGKEDMSEKIDKLLSEISTFTGDFLGKVSRFNKKTDGKAKEFFRNLYADWDKGVEAIVEKMEKL